MASKTLKIVHCPSMVGGNPQGLSSGEKQLGLNSKSICLIPTYFSYQADEIVFKDKSPLIVNEIRRWRTVFKILLNSDIIHFNFGETLAPNRLMNQSGKYAKWKIWLYNNLYARWVEFIDLKLARLLGKIVTVTYQGNDARQGDYCLRNYDIHFCHDVGETYYTPKTDAEKRRRIGIFDRYAHYIYAVNPDLLNVLPQRASFIPYASVNHREWPYIPSAGNSDEELHIIHAPSHRGVKGTRYLLDALERLKDEGLKFRFTLVEGLSNREAQEIYRQADILVDQLLAGYYGALAVELMALGKPVICYVRDSDLHHMPQEMRKDIPIINATPESIYGILKECLTHRKHELPDIGKRGRSYVERWHDPLTIAQKMYEDSTRALKQRDQLT